MTIALWDLDSGNMLARFDSERAAFDAVSRLSNSGQTELALEYLQPGRPVVVLSGDALLKKALAPRSKAPTKVAGPSAVAWRHVVAEKRYSAHKMAKTAKRSSASRVLSQKPSRKTKRNPSK